MSFVIILTALAALAIAGTVTTVLRDGYRRSPARRTLREYERDEHLRAWRGRA